MTKWAVTIYDTFAAAETAIELIDNDVDLKVFGFQEGAHQKVFVARGRTIA